MFAGASTLTLGPAGFGVHTLKPAPSELRELMPRKVDSNGHIVLTPGISAAYRWRGQEIALALISDSFSNPAFAGVYGWEWDLDWKDFSWGLVGGIYVRKSIQGCHAFNFQTICISNAKDLPVKFNVGGGASRTDFAPILGLQLNYSPKISQSFRLDVNLVTALYISLLTVGLRFDWEQSNGH